jgi:cysteine synthase
LFPRYSREEYNKYFLVNGKKNNKNMDYYYCSTAREFHNMCGKEGNFHEKRKM